MLKAEKNLNNNLKNNNKNILHLVESLFIYKVEIKKV